ncbi:hypothetical protein FNV43_RR15593 [Rhamnella rubrinervis]|uniref:Uncharacterized protein n=1 Tax=Rhamnella rubrinervis TaxID=2594499 RepID=A0A8K0E826_9ROSA|nr:hypothetical protein FNV43_RR15593 [Rhamnella rubrinervis]
MADVVRDTARVELADSSGDMIANMEDDEDLFEIDLEAVHSIPPPYYWDSYVTATGNARMANCLVPISDVSSAVPMVSKACDALSLAGTVKILTAMKPMPLEKPLGLPFLGALGLQAQHKKMEA